MKTFLSFILLVVFVSNSNGQDFLKSPGRKKSVSINAQAIDLKTNQLRQKTFDIVWSTINEVHYDTKFGGVDWVKMKKIYQPKAMKTISDDDFHTVLSQMISELKRSHLSISSKNQIVKNNLCQEGTIGLKVKIIENQPIVFNFESGSSAERSGLKKGFIINQIDDELVSDIFQKAEIIFNQRQTLESYRKRLLEGSISGRLCGKPDSTVKIIALDENSKPQTFKVVREKSSGLSFKMGTLNKKLTYVSKKLENNIGYIAFSNWKSQLEPYIKESIGQFLETKGIIIDLRGNSGGEARLYKNLAGYLFTEKVYFGTFKSRFEQNEEVVDPKLAQFRETGKGKSTLEPVKYNYKGKIVVLVDYGCFSASEVFAAGMQENGRAKIVGERTVGGVLAAVYQTLPTGGLFGFPIAEYKTRKGIVLEGRGVEPDISVALTRESLLQGRDLQLEIAVKELSK